MDKKRILIIRFSSLGDLVLVHPVIKKLYNKGYKVDLLTKKAYKEIFASNPYINKIIYLEDHKGILNLVKCIKRIKYYKLIDLHKNLRSSIIKSFFCFKTITYKKYRFRRFLLVRLKINLLKNNSIILNYLNTLKRLGLNISNSDMNYKIYYNENKKLLKLFNKKIITVSPFARYYTKEWLYYKELISFLSKKYHVVIFGEKGDYKKAGKMVNKNVSNLCGEINLNDISCLINKSVLLITNDSGIMHLGVGTDTPMISIFGSTSKYFGFYPGRKNIKILANDNLRCRPCHYHGRRECPEKHFNCMKNIKLKDVVRNVKKFIKI